MPLNQRTVILTDDKQRSGDIARSAPLPSNTYMLDIGTVQDPSLSSCGSVIIDVPLADRDAVAAVHHQLKGARRSLRKIFIADPTQRRDCAQANSLGANEIVTRDRLLCEFGAILGLHEPDADVAFAAEHVEDVYRSIFDAVERGEPLPRKDVDDCAELISRALMAKGITAWLEELKKHHSYTHRHSMHVTGFAVAFGLHYGMRQTDVQRLGVGALMHDVGKAQIPLKILDKPTALTRKEKEQINLHVMYGAAILEQDGNFDVEVIDIVRHHHEYLDGTGYPDGLSGDEISDIVRIVAIADIFSALVDQRAYKASHSKETAYATMREMRGKLDQKLVQAFEPIALGSEGVILPKAVAS